MKASFISPAAMAALALLFLVCELGPASAAETECAVTDDWVACQAQKGDRMAIYTQGRNAYEGARTSGDFSEALTYSRQLAAAGDKNGERLLKMVYMQLGWGAHRDYVQSYVWLTEGIAGGADYLVQWRNMLTKKMTPDQITEAIKKISK
ncbi:MAG: hypothetical protein ABIP64_12890 [Burkholderiales bacterium]